MPAYRVALARVCSPPDTSKLERCGEAETARAIAVMSARTLRYRRALAARCATGPALERLLGVLRRLQSPDLAAYRVSDGVLLSEPFGAKTTVVTPLAPPLARDLVIGLLGRSPPRILVDSLACFGAAVLQRAVAAGVRAVIVPKRQSFSQCSRSVAALVPDIDRWHAPPAGLFVLEERLLLLRPHALRMAAAHEFAHALDAVLASKPNSYFSFESAEIRSAFASATGFVNEYAASGLDEYFAECVRAYVEVNDDRSSWLPLTRQGLAERDPRMYAIVERIFTDIGLGTPVEPAATS